MIGGRMSPGVLWTCATLSVLVQAGPLLRFPRESEDYPNADFSNYTANEVCFSDQKVFQRGEEVPNAGPCEECRCEPPSIVCQMLKCPVNNNGCRTIQRPNHCCPDYNCECDYNGQLYNDGERIDLPEDPCQVCYCKGGDVMCTSITCYHRDDCEPKHVPGQCCPKYEDCPIRDMEASNTEDKNVQTRSPNKTMNSNPKKEMQPWLLTKSVPQTSSSLAIPKSGETTTDSGSVIIVSDWLVERKTTEDTHTKQTEDPNLTTHQEFITTIQPQKPTQHIEQEINLGKTMQTVKPTPVDEVVFTRIDIPKRIQDEIRNPLTTIASTTIESSTLYTLTQPEDIKDFKIVSDNTTWNSSYKYSEEKSIAEKNSDEYSRLSTLYKEPENESTATMSSTDELGEITLSKTSDSTQKLPIKVKAGENDGVISSTPGRFNVNITENSLDLNEKKESQEINELSQNNNVTTDSETKLLEDFQGPPNMLQGTTASDNKDRSPEEMTLEQLFGLEKIEQEENTKQISTSTEKYSNILLDKHKNNDYTTFPTKIEKPSMGYNSTDIFSKTKPTEIVKSGEIKHVDKNGLTVEENSSPLYELLSTTETSYEDKETTIYFTSESNMNKLLLQSGEFKHENDEKYEETYLPETTTEIETPTLLVANNPKEINGEAKENLLDNLIEGKHDDKTDYHTNIETTTHSNTENSGYTDPVTFESRLSSTTQGLQLNTESILNHESHLNNKQEASHTYTSMVNPSIDSSSTTDKEEKNKNTLSEIEIILGETNSTNMLDKSISSQESNEHDEVILDLAFDEISSENKEIIHDNNPPVLQLNSHVPFLQIGGDGNSESSDIEYNQTTVVNNLDVDSVNKKVLKGNKDIIKIVHKEATPNSSLTVIPSTTTPALSKTKEQGNEKVEELTIPTIAVVPLTPGDLKMIAEYLISEKIKPVSSKNNSIFSPNQWLKGNLTSEENIASILSAANVSIGLMNETSIGRKLETLNKSNASVQLEKFENEPNYKSNSLLENKNSIKNSKADRLHDKSGDNQEVFKTTIQSQEEINIGTLKGNKLLSESTSDSLRTTTTMPLSKVVINKLKEDSEEIQNLKLEGTSTEMISKEDNIQKHKLNTSLKSDQDFSKMTTLVTNNTDHKIINELTTKTLNESKQNKSSIVDNSKKYHDSINIQKTDNIVTIENKVNQDTSQIISRLSVSGDKASDSSTNNSLDTTSSNVVNKPSHEGISS